MTSANMEICVFCSLKRFINARHATETLLPEIWPQLDTIPEDEAVAKLLHGLSLRRSEQFLGVIASLRKIVQHNAKLDHVLGECESYDDIISCRCHHAAAEKAPRSTLAPCVSAQATGPWLQCSDNPGSQAARPPTSSDLGHHLAIVSAYSEDTSTSHPSMALARVVPSKSQKQQQVTGLPFINTMTGSPNIPVGVRPGPTTGTQDRLIRCSVFYLNLFTSGQWNEVDTYDQWLMDKYPNDEDVKSCIDIHKIFRRYCEGKAEEGLELLPSCQRGMANAKSGSFLNSYFAAIASGLCRKDHHFRMADGYLKQALVEAEGHSPDKGSALLHERKAILCLHWAEKSLIEPTDVNIKYTIPKEDQYGEAEKHIMAAYEHYQRNALNVKMPGCEMLHEFELWVLLEYVFILLRTCVAGVFHHTWREGIPTEQWASINQALAAVQANENILSNRRCVYYQLALCDKELRLAEQNVTSVESRVLGDGQMVQMVDEHGSIINQDEGLTHASTEDSGEITSRERLPRARRPEQAATLRSSSVSSDARKVNLILAKDHAIQARAVALHAKLHLNAYADRRIVMIAKMIDDIDAQQKLSEVSSDTGSRIVKHGFQVNLNQEQECQHSPPPNDGSFDFRSDGISNGADTSCSCVSDYCPYRTPGGDDHRDSSREFLCHQARTGSDSRAQEVKNKKQSSVQTLQCPYLQSTVDREGSDISLDLRSDGGSMVRGLPKVAAETSLDTNVNIVAAVPIEETAHCACMGACACPTGRSPETVVTSQVKPIQETTPGTHAEGTPSGTGSFGSGFDITSLEGPDNPQPPAAGH